MARRRMIDPSIWDDEDVGVLSDGAFKTLIGCISNADDEGKLDTSPRRLRGIIFRFKNISVLRVQAYLEEIDNALRSVMFYRVNGREYMKFLNWSKYQTINRPSKSSLPEPDKVDSLNDHACLHDDSPRREVKRREVKRSKEKGSTRKSAVSGKPKPSPPGKEEVIGCYRSLCNERLSADKVSVTDDDAHGISNLLKSGETVEEICKALDFYIGNPDYAWADWTLATFCGKRYAAIKAKATGKVKASGHKRGDETDYSKYVQPICGGDDNGEESAGAESMF